jgi:hypothetical protein
MPFKHFLKHSIDFERTHQLILKSLFTDVNFARVITGQSFDEAINVTLEPFGSLFDLGLFRKDANCACLIELKMWSGLSNAQLERQTKFLKDNNYLGLHILLGTSDLQFYKNDLVDDIAEMTGGFSKKIGYKELISYLAKFVEIWETSPIKQIAQEYMEALNTQWQDLEGAWLNPEAHNHFRFYSTYNKIRNFLPDGSFPIYTVNNAGGAVYIMNDDSSWKGFTYCGYNFQVYQEILDNHYMIRIFSDDVPNHIRNEVKSQFIEYFKKTEFFNLGWSFDLRASKYHKIAVFNPRFETLSDCQQIALLFGELNPVIKNIALRISN